MSQSIVSSLKSFLFYALNYTLAFLIFGFVMLNAVQLLWKLDLKGAQALERFEYGWVVDNLIEDFQKIGVDELALAGQQYVRPEFMKIPKNDIQIAIDQEYFIDGERWIRPATAHFATLNLDKQGRVGDTVVYMKQTWQTIPDTGILTNGNVISIESVGGGQIDYEIVETYTLGLNDRYVATGSNSRQLILLVIKTNGTYSITRATSEIVKDKD